MCIFLGFKKIFSADIDLENIFEKKTVIFIKSCKVGKSEVKYHRLKHAQAYFLPILYLVLYREVSNVKLVLKAFYGFYTVRIDAFVPI